MFFSSESPYEDAHRFSRLDPKDPLSTCSPHSISLEGHTWLTCEHYFQIKTLRSAEICRSIDQMQTGLEAYLMGCPWYRRHINDWKKLRPVLMTRALYTKVQMYDEVREALLATGEQTIVETSLYDYYWGIGRDQRGENRLGKVWMDIRRKLREPKAVEES